MLSQPWLAHCREPAASGLPNQVPDRKLRRRLNRSLRSQGLRAPAGAQAVHGCPAGAEGCCEITSSTCRWLPGLRLLVRARSAAAAPPGPAPRALLLAESRWDWSAAPAQAWPSPAGSYGAAERWPACLLEQGLKASAGTWQGLQSLSWCSGASDLQPNRWTDSWHRCSNLAQRLGWGVLLPRHAASIASRSAAALRSCVAPCYTARVTAEQQSLLMSARCAVA